MSLLAAFFLAILQGITEFFPISSSAHLKLMRSLLQMDNSPMLFFDLTCHLGTTIAATIFLFKEIKALFIEQRKELLSIFCAIIPLIPFYLTLKPFFQFLSQSNLFPLLMCVNGVILLVCCSLTKDRANQSLSSPLKDGFFIGVMQAFALLPGLSRSGMTISGAFLRGWDFTRAVRFSFLLAIPTIMGGEIIEIFHIFTKETLFNFSLPVLFIAFGTSLFVGFFSIRLFFKFQEKKKLLPFGWYCLTVGLISFIYLNWF